VKLRNCRLRIRGFGANPSETEVEVGTLSAGERLRRGALGPAIGLGVAVLVLPIPIVHFAVPPVALVGGVIAGIRRVLQREIFTTARGVCPLCGATQSLGLNGATYRLPRALKCQSCLRPLTLEAS
jgi:hypothetical protein